MVRFVKNSLSFNQLSNSRVDIPCVLENGAGDAARSAQPITLNMTVNIRPPNLQNTPPSILTGGGDPLAEEATTISERIQSPATEHLSSKSHHQPVETSKNMPQSREEVSPTSPENPRLAVDRADKAMNRIAPIDGSNTWEVAIGRIKWLMDTLTPVAGVRAVPF